MIRDFEDVPMGDSPLVPRRSASGDYAVEPKDLRALQLAVAWANLHRIPIRIRGNGLSTNGASIPRPGELHVSLASCRHHRFEEGENTITVGSGALVGEVRATVASHGFEWRVYPEGEAAASTVGSYLATARHGGFWETVQEVVMVTGDGRVRRLARGHDEFPRLFGSMGQLGIAYELKLRIRRTPRATRRVPKADWLEAAKRILAIGARHGRAWRARVAKRVSSLRAP